MYAFLQVTKTYIGIDNGVSGTIAILHPKDAEFYVTPVFRSLDYTKKKQWVNRIDHNRLLDILGSVPRISALVLLERPMIDPTRFTATKSAIRAMEATLITIERLAIPYQWIDSRQWQKVMLPNGCVGKELKVASLQIARQLYPNLKITRDGDAVLMAEWARRIGL